MRAIPIYLFLIAIFSLVFNACKDKEVCYECDQLVGNCYECIDSLIGLHAEFCASTTDSIEITYRVSGNVIGELTAPVTASDFATVLDTSGYTCSITGQKTIEKEFCDDGEGSSITVTTTMNGISPSNSTIQSSGEEHVSELEDDGYDCAEVD